MQIPEPLYPRNGKRTTNKKKIIARGRKRERERQVAADEERSRRKRGEEARESVRAGTLGHRFTRLPLFYDPAKCRPPPPPHCPAPTPTIGRQGQAATRLDSTRIDPPSFSKNSTRLRSSRNSPRPFANIKVAARFTEGEARPRALVSTR